MGLGVTPNKTLQQTAATGIALPGLGVVAVAAAAELGRSARGRLSSLGTLTPLRGHGAFDRWRVEISIVVLFTRRLLAVLVSVSLL
jgi:hypothetical protein